MAKITIDFNKTIGKIKPLHGVGQPPFQSVSRGVDFSGCELLKEAGIPFSRLHDVGGAYGGNRYVDISNIFRDFSKDEYDENSYDFAFTDLLITALVENGVQPVFRLGVTIENQCTVKPLRIFPPEDNKKWAVICEHIIKHYNEGWADGFHYDIKYWEIWNEPDNNEDIATNQMWHGTKEQFFELYKVASKHLKGKFPHLKIGGYGSCGFYGIVPECKEDMNPAAFGRHTYFIEFFEEFVKFAKENKCPLDFFSWHAYGANINIEEYANYSRKVLDDAGFTETETSLNEWDAGFDYFGTGKQAAIIMETICRMQHLPIDSAMIYDARFGTGRYSMVFGNRTKREKGNLYEKMNPYGTYYAFMAFNELYKRQTEVFAETDDKELYVLAAKGGNGAILVVNPTDETKTLEFDTNLPLGDFFATDTELKMSLTPVKTKIMPGSVLLIKTK